MKKTILIIEDDAILQKNIKSALESADFRVAQAFNGLRIAKIIEKEKPDLILLDLILPGKDGFLILRDIKDDKRFEKIPVVVLTAIGTESSINECKMLGADDYLIKADYTLKTIVKKVKEKLK